MEEIENTTIGGVRIADILREYRDVFLFTKGGTSDDGHLGSHVTLQPTLGTYEDRTSAVGDVIRSLGEDVFPGLWGSHEWRTISMGWQEESNEADRHFLGCLIILLLEDWYIQPEDAGYLKLLQSLRSGDCS
ncbi:Nudix hydrolase 20, chloroplastic-like protein [Drosera capensis]